MSETLSYWQSGAYLRCGDVDINVCQWKDKLVLQVLARTKSIAGTRQAVNKAWCCLTKYLYTVEMILASFPGLYYEVSGVFFCSFLYVLKRRNCLKKHYSIRFVDCVFVCILLFWL